MHLVLGLNVERDRRVLGLQRGDGVHGVRAAEGVYGAAGEAEVLDLTGPGEDPSQNEAAREYEERT